MVAPESKETSQKAPDIEPTILVIFGATGDLASRKIFPSLFHLHRHRRLPERFAIIGYGRRELTDEKFRDLVREAIVRKMPETDATSLEEFLKTFSYHHGTFEDAAAYQSLADTIARKESVWGMCGNKLFYFAVPPETYPTIFERLAQVRLNLPCGGETGWSRFLIEKPFGSDLKTAEELESLLSKYFKEDQIYRIDHYLFKEIVLGIEHFRFSNNLFENNWGAETIERIDIRLLESIGVEERGAFYDPVGALRDVGQNHLLAMLSAVTAGYPAGSSPEEIQNSRAQALEALAPWNPTTIECDTYRAQYEKYAEIAGVAEGSKTETYFALKTELRSAQWRGVTIYMEAGKRTGEPVKEIVITLRHPQKCLLCETGAHGPNTITFRIEPNDEIVIRFWTKKPGFERTLEERAFSFFLYEKETKSQYVEEYSKVLNAAMRGDRGYFSGAGEIRAMWEFTDPVVEAWKKGTVQLDTYAKDTRPRPDILAKKADEHKAEKGVLGMVGLGKMGAGIARKLTEEGWRIVGFDNYPKTTQVLEKEGVIGAYSLGELIGKLEEPRTVWIMVPHEAVDTALSEILPHLSSGDTVIDGGNSPYKESIRRAAELKVQGIRFLDVGVSGGPGGARSGACLMIGGEREDYLKLETLFEDMSIDKGYAYLGNHGAGHFAKMVHNGIEYGMMQAIAEGFTVLKKSSFSFDLLSLAELYNRGSVITSRLVGWLSESLGRYGVELDTEECCSPTVGYSGEGEWTVEAAHELGVEVPIIEGSFNFRVESKDKPTYTGRVLSAMRRAFGGHDTRTKSK